MAKLRYVILGAASSVIGASQFAYAQVTPDLNQQQRQQFEERQQELQRIAPPGGSVVLPGAPTPQTQSPVCVTVTRIQIQGADHLPASDLQQVAQPYIGKCLNLTDINNIVEGVDGLFIAHSFVTSRAYLPQQNLSSGTLTIIAVEGKLQGFKFEGEPADQHVEAAFPGLIGHLVNLRDLEQGLEQMNRLGSWNATMHVAPGSVAGESIVVIEAPKAIPVYGKVYTDNTSTNETGRWSGHVQANLDDPLGLLDAWSAEYDHNVFPVPATREANYATATLSIPHGYWTAYATYTFSNYRYPVAGLAEVFQLTGHQQRWDFGLDRVIARDQFSKTSFELGYHLEQVGSDLDQVKLVTGSEQLASLTQRLSYSRQMFGGAYEATFGVEEGLPREGTNDTLPVSSPYAPHAAFVKPSIDINAQQPFKVFGHQLVWEPSLHGEYSTATEYPIDRLQIGGVYTVRGFLNDSFAGDHGVYMHNDIVCALPAISLPHEITSLTALYVGLDAGFDETNAAETGTAPGMIRATLAGAAIGLRNTTGPFFADIAATHAIANGPLPPEGWIFTVQAGVKF